jgi:hypothetical protein
LLGAFVGLENGARRERELVYEEQTRKVDTRTKMENIPSSIPIYILLVEARPDAPGSWNRNTPKVFSMGSRIYVYYYN